MAAKEKNKGCLVPETTFGEVVRWAVHYPTRSRCDRLTSFNPSREDLARSLLAWILEQPQRDSWGKEELKKNVFEQRRVLTSSKDRGSCFQFFL